MTAETLPMIAPPRAKNRERCDINRGLLDGCSVYLSEQDRFSVRTGTFDREIHDKFSEFSQNTEVFLDIGAAEGFYSVYMLKNTEAKVYSFESAPNQSNHLLRNLEENTRNGHRLQFGTEELGSSCDHNRTTIDTIAAHESGSIFMKIDSNGTEVAALRGAERILNRDNTKLIVKVTSKSSEQECLWILDEYGFDISIIGPAWWRAIVRDRSSEDPHRWIIAEKSEIGLVS